MFALLSLGLARAQLLFQAPNGQEFGLGYVSPDPDEFARLRVKAVAEGFFSSNNLFGLPEPTTKKRAEDPLPREFSWAEGTVENNENKRQLPAEFSWSSTNNPTGADAYVPPQNQGQCGSCYIWAALGAAEAIACMQNREWCRTKLSEQQYLDCWEEQRGNACSGGFYWDVWNMMGVTGSMAVSADRRAEYRGNPSRACREYAAIETPRVHTVQGRDGQWSRDRARRVPYHEESMKRALQDGPLGAAVVAGGNFPRDCGAKRYQVDRDGSYVEQRGANHAVVLVGWSDSRREWILRNSWGTGWGQRGYFTFPMDPDRNGYLCHLEFLMQPFVRVDSRSGRDVPRPQPPGPGPRPPAPQPWNPPSWPPAPAPSWEPAPPPSWQPAPAPRPWSPPTWAPRPPPPRPRPQPPPADDDPCPGDQDSFYYERDGTVVCVYYETQKRQDGGDAGAIGEPGPVADEDRGVVDVDAPPQPDPTAEPVVVVPYAVEAVVGGLVSWDGMYLLPLTRPAAFPATVSFPLDHARAPGLETAPVRDNMLAEVTFWKAGPNDTEPVYLPLIESLSAVRLTLGGVVWQTTPGAAELDLLQGPYGARAPLCTDSLAGVGVNVPADGELTLTLTSWPDEAADTLLLPLARVWFVERDVSSTPDGAERCVHSNVPALRQADDDAAEFPVAAVVGLSIAALLIGVSCCAAAGLLVATVLARRRRARASPRNLVSLTRRPSDARVRRSATRSRSSTRGGAVRL